MVQTGNRPVTFDRAFEFVIGVEGGYVNDPRDPGGETIYGITRRDHPDAWRTGRPTLDAAKEIYKTRYWAPAQCDKLDWPLSFFVFDSAVNQGVGTAIKLLQKTIGTVQDGMIGQNTLRALQAREPMELCALYLAHRGLRYTGTRNFDRYGLGWFKRLFKIAMEA